MKKNILFLACCLMLSHILRAQPYGTSSQTFDASGVFYVPLGVTSITIECWGAGGNASGTVNGGGGGAYTRAVINSVGTGQEWIFNVATGGSTSPTTAYAGGIKYVTANSAYFRLKGDASSIGGNIVASYSGGDGGEQFLYTNNNTNYYNRGGGGAAAGRNGNGAFGGNGTATNHGNDGVGTDGGGSGGGGVPGGGQGYNVQGTPIPGANGRVIVWWTCPYVNNSTLINTTHTIPFPQELTSDKLSVSTPLRTGYNLQYRWYSSLNGAPSEYIPNSLTTNPNGGYDFVSYINTIPTNTRNNLKTIDFTLQSNACNTSRFSNAVRINVYQTKAIPNLKNGKIIGRVVSNNGTGVAGVTIKAKKSKSLLGSPQSFERSTITDAVGNFTLDTLFYGAPEEGGTTFILTPSKGNHVFDSDTRTTSLLSSFTPTSENINGINQFKDLTVFTISGKAFQKCDTCCDSDGVPVASIIAPLDGVDMFKDNAFFMKTGYLDPPAEFGRYATTVSDPGNYTIKPQFGTHIFSPVQTTLTNVQEDRPNVDFEDKTWHFIEGYLRAGCNDYIGRADLIFEEVLPKGSTRPLSSIIRRKITTSDQTGYYKIWLPARKYKVNVKSFYPSDTTKTDPNYIASTDLIAFLSGNFGGTNNINALPLDSISRDITDKNDTINLIYQRPPVIKLFGLDNVCTNADPAKTFALVEQGKTVYPEIKVYQGDPIDPTRGCKLYDSTVFISTNVPGNDINKIDTLKVDTSGIVVDKVMGGDPNILAPFTKNYTIYYTDKYSRNATTISRNVLVTGAKSRNGSFATVSPQIPMLILHDPPGDKSYSFQESGTTTERAGRWRIGLAGGVETYQEVKLGAEFSTFGVSTKVWGSINNKLSVSASTNYNGETVYSTTTTQRVETSQDEDVTGEEGDVYQGAAVNLLYAIADEVKLNGCTIDTSRRLIINPNGFATEYNFTEHDIRTSVIPDLQSFVNDVTQSESRRQDSREQIRVWEQILANNAMNKANAALDKNISFVGSDGPISSQTTTTSTLTNTLDFGLEIEKSVALELGAEIAGSGAKGGATVNVKFETGGGVTWTNVKQTSTGYVLDDNDKDDRFTVNIKKDPVYGTPIFQTVGGRSSCPPEPGTLFRDEMQFIVPIPRKSGVPATDPAIFTMSIGNLSVDATPRTYILSFDQTSNPNAAIISIQNVVYNTPLSLTLNNKQVIPITVKVVKDPNSNVFSYEGLRFTLTDACTGDVTKSQTISAYFKTDCSDIKMVAPENNWLNRQTDYNVLPVTFKDYDVTKLDNVSLEYAPAGTSNWNTAFIKQKSQINNSVNGTSVDWDVSGYPDGQYNLRLKLGCSQGFTYTERITGTIDRTAPKLFGLPQPSNGKYKNGDVISFSYNENIATNDLNNNKVEMKRMSDGSSIPVSVTGSGNTLAIVPQTNLNAFTFDSILVVVKNVADVYGNVDINRRDTLRFDVGTFVANTGNKAVNLSAYPLTMNENNIGTMDVEFAINSAPTDEVQVNYTIGGTAEYLKDYTVSYVSTDIPGNTTFNGAQGSIVIPKNSTSVKLKIDPIGDALSEGNETIIIALASGGDYQLGANNTQTVTINDDELPLSIDGASFSYCPLGSASTLSLASSSSALFTRYVWSTGETTPQISVSGSGTYQVTGYTVSGELSVSKPFIVNIPFIGNPAIFGEKSWNVYVWNAGDGIRTSPLNWKTNYSGYYTDPQTDINTTLRWDPATTPSNAIGYVGCPVNADNHSYSYKRKGFDCGYYQLDVPGHEDGSELWINGVMVWEHNGCCDSHTNVWTGYLSSTDSIEFRTTEANGGSYQKLTFTKLLGVGTAITGGNTICLTNTRQLSNKTPGGIWSSSDPTKVSVSSTGVITGVAVGSATISYTALSLCGDSSSVVSTILINAVSGTIPAVPAITGTGNVCAGSKITLTNTKAGGVWSLNNPSIASINSTTGVLTGISGGFATAFYTISNAAGCTGTTTKTINVSALPVISPITGMNTTCVGNATKLTTTTNAGTWNSSNPTIASVSTTGLVSGIANGTSVISYTVTNSRGCVNELKDTITVLPIIAISSVTAEKNPICINETTNLIANGVPISKDIKVTWWTGSNGSGTMLATGPILFNVKAGTYFARVTGSCGTPVESSVTLVSVAIPTVGAITGTKNVCLGSNRGLGNTVKGGSWKSSDSTIATISSTGIVKGISVGSVIITYTTLPNASGCTNSVTTPFAVIELPPVNPIVGASTVCVGGKVTYTNATIGGKWSVSDTSKAIISTAGVVTTKKAGNVIIRYTTPVNTSGCAGVASLTLTINSLPAVPVISGNTNVCIGTQSKLSATPTGGVWTSNSTAVATVNSTTGLVTGKTAGNATITFTTVANANGCKNRGTVVVTVPATCFANPVFAKSITQDNEVVPSKLEVTIFPNPTGKVFNVKVISTKQEIVSIKVLDVNGRTSFITKGMPGQVFRFGEQLMSGTYLIEVKQGEDVKTVKAVKILHGQQ